MHCDTVLSTFCAPMSQFDKKSNYDAFTNSDIGLIFWMLGMKFFKKINMVTLPNARHSKGVLFSRAQVTGYPWLLARLQ